MALASSGVQWGDVATWVGSIGTALAFFATFVLLVITRQEQKAAREEDRRAQARQVSAWCVRVQPASGEVTITVQNSSDEPVYGMLVAVGAKWSREMVRFAEAEGLSYVTPPKYKKDHAAHLTLSPMPGGGYDKSLPVEIIFNDASGGIFWRRDRYGGLARLDVDGPQEAAGALFTRPANVAGYRRFRALRGRLPSADA
jgi:hypothetical protein